MHLKMNWYRTLSSSSSSWQIIQKYLHDKWRGGFPFWFCHTGLKQHHTK